MRLFGKDQLFSAIKIASGDLDFEAVIRSAAATGKPLLPCTGLGTVDEINRAVGWIADASPHMPQVPRAKHHGMARLAD